LSTDKHSAAQVIPSLGGSQKHISPRPESERYPEPDISRPHTTYFCTNHLNIILTFSLCHPNHPFHSCFGNKML